ncbi:hypothetical protein BS47DRAFT_1328834 [Hydnum rufescens UP504]|uniref:Uncharacterized protein n=1 Tax=Hydnum rufescens UP504 TaxID=1448309 RepID=A0A9P6AYN0_9AGAM|nr:hypothetical protein BS47DRAFT_1328834 [Hydnum rufescens UP504]
MLSTITTLGFLAAVASYASAESHTVRFTNSCGWGVQPVICSNSISGYCTSPGYLNPRASNSYTHSGPFVSWISYGQGNGIHCGTNGEHCLITEGTLQNLNPCKGCNSVDLSLIPPHAYNFGNSFSFSDGSGGHGCETADCPTAFHQDGNDGKYQIQSNGHDISITIDFCNSRGNY